MPPLFQSMTQKPDDFQPLRDLWGLADSAFVSWFPIYQSLGSYATHPSPDGFFGQSCPGLMQLNCRMSHRNKGALQFSYHIIVSPYSKQTFCIFNLIMPTRCPSLSPTQNWVLWHCSGNNTTLVKQLLVLHSLTNSWKYNAIKECQDGSRLIWTSARWSRRGYGRSQIVLSDSVW